MASITQRAMRGSLSHRGPLSALSSKESTSLNTLPGELASSQCKSAINRQRTPDQDSIGQRESFKRGLTALKENRLDAALVELTAAERQDATDPRIHNFSVIVLARLDQSKEAAPESQENSSFDPL